MHNVAETCSVPGCLRPLPSPARPGRERVCAAGHPSQTCGACLAANWLLARVCRRCRSGLVAPQPGSQERASQQPTSRTETRQPPPDAPAAPAWAGTPRRHFLPGTFRRPPLLWAGTAWALSADGAVLAMPLAPGATPQPVTGPGALPVAAAANRSALVLVAALPSLPRAGGAEVLLAAHPGGVDAVVLATGQVVPVYRPAPGAELAVNPADNSTGLTGVAATATHCAVAERTGPGDVALRVLALGTDQGGAGSQAALRLRGDRVAGPVACGGVFALCTSSAVGICCPANGRTALLELPRGVEAVLARTGAGPELSPGTVPLTAGCTDAGFAAHLLATRDGLHGLLRVGTDAPPAWEPLGRGSSLSANADGSLVLVGNDELRLLDGGASTLLGRARLAFGMPGSLPGGGLLAAFLEERFRGLHRLELRVPGGQAAELLWEDAAADEHGLSAPAATGGYLAVSYPAEEAGNSGLAFAVWDTNPAAPAA